VDTGDCSLEKVYADRRRLKQVMITSWTMPSSTRRRRIDHRQRQHEGTDAVCVEVADTGSGIPENSISPIFERFYRATRTAPGMWRDGLAWRS